MLKTSAFVLRRNNYREYDRIYTVYTADYGKVSLLARGARRIKSKLAPSLENFGEVKIDFANGKVFNHLAGAKTVIKNNRILKDNNKILLAQDLFYLFDRFVKLGEHDAGMFGLLRESLEAINNLPDVIASPSEGVAIPSISVIPHLMRDLEIAAPAFAGVNLRTPRNADGDFSKISVYFFWRLVDLLGYRPQLDECALCGKVSRKQQAVSSKVKFNITDNIIICSKCIGEGIFIQENSLESLKNIFRSSLEEFLKIELDSQLTAITEKAKQIKLSEL